MLNNLLHAATAFAGVDPLPTEATIIKSLRTHANDRFDVRMILAGVASRSAKHGRLDTGGYEVRRKDWQEVVQHMKDGTFTRTHWQKRTIYIVNMVYLALLCLADLVLRPTGKYPALFPDNGRNNTSCGVSAVVRLRTLEHQRQV